MRNPGLDQFFHQNPVFTHEDFVRFNVTSDYSQQAQTLSNRLNYYLKTEKIVAIKRSLYKVLAPNETPRQYSLDPYLVMNKLTPDAVIGYHSALQFYGHSYSIQSTHSFLTATKVKTLSTPGLLFTPTAFPTALVQTNQTLAEVKNLERQGVNLRVTSLERTFVDVFDRHELGGGWEEIWRSFENVDYLHYDKVIDYALILNTLSLNLKIGYYLYINKERFMIPEAALNRLLLKKPVSPLLFDRGIKQNNKLNKKWHLLIPESIAHQRWKDTLP